MGIKEDREKLKTIYPTRKWIMKVNRMSDIEVKTILKRLRQQGKVAA